MRTPLVAVTAAAGFVGLLVLSEAVARRWSLAPEHARKLAHVSSGLAAAALPAVLPFAAIAAIAAGFIPFMVVSRRLQLFPLLHSAERSTHGEIYFPVGILLVAVFVPSSVEYAFGVLVLALADAAAGLLGQAFGRRTYDLGWGRKSYLGSGVFLVTTLLLGVAAAAAIEDLSTSVLLGVAAIAAVTTVEEAVAGGGLDNVFLPVTAAAMFQVLT